METSKAKGDILEDEVFDLFRQHVLSGDSFLNPDKCEFHKQKGYYSKDRENLIKVDMSIEAFTANSDQWSILVVVECKNYNHPVPVDDLEEFVEKLNQIAGKNVKGYVFTRIGFQKGALKYAASKGIALARLLPYEQVEWILQRTPNAVMRKDKRQFEQQQVEEALTNTDFVGICESLFCIYGELKSCSFLNVFNRVIGEDNREITRKNVRSKSLIATIPYLGQGDIEKRVQKMLDFFCNGPILRTYETNLNQICKFLNNNHKVKFIFKQDLGLNAHGKEVLGKFEPHPPKIHISRSMEFNSPRWRFTLAHEIGHLILHRKIQISNLFDRVETADTIGWNYTNGVDDNIRVVEWQANSFASSLLMPMDLIYHIVMLCLEELSLNNYSHGIIYLDDQPCNIKSYHRTLSRLNKEFNVSFQSIGYRLAQLRLVNDRRRCTHIREIIKSLPLVQASQSRCSSGSDG